MNRFAPLGIALVCSTCAAPAVVPEVAPPREPDARAAIDVAASLDAVIASPDVYRTRLENDHVRVLEMRLSPGRRDKQHSHPAEAVLFLQPGIARISLPDGRALTKAIAAGEVMWNDAWTHQVENVGNSEISRSLSS